MSYGGHYYKDTAFNLRGGRYHFDLRNSFAWKDGGFAGVVELSRLSCMDPQQCARGSIGTMLTGMQMVKATELGILIPQRKADVERFRPASSLLVGDRGGFIYDPKVGLHFNVGETDFTSMFPKIMTTFNVSPETVNCECCKTTGLPVPGTDYYTCTRQQGLIPQVLEMIVNRRLYFKGRKKEHERYDQLQKTLKWILVTCFGYMGYRNARWGRIEAHETINAYARALALKVAKLGEAWGLQLVAGIVDSLYLKFPNERAFPPDLLQELCTKGSELTKLPISPEGVYRWIVFLPRRHEPAVGVLNRYYGVFHDGTVKVRGIELRKRDTCLFVRTAQEKMIELLAPATTRNEFENLIQKCIKLLTECSDNLLSGGVPVEDLVISKVLSQAPQDYVQGAHQAIAAQQLARAGKRLQSGMKVTYVVVNDKATRAGERVAAYDLIKPEKVDIEWYQEQLHQALTSLIPPDVRSPKTALTPIFRKNHTLKSFV
jgi:DNA polymerase elongation subunit (family B)